ncbi:MAG: replication initiation factor [Gammaproteobacteria bacterium]
MKKEVDPDKLGTGDPARSADASGAPPSNTAPTNYIQIFRNGIDSIYLSYPGNLYPDKNNELADKKVLAQSPIPLEKAEAKVFIGAHVFKVHDKGKGLYPYVLSGDAYHIQLSGVSSRQLPLAYVQVRSEYLTQNGIYAIKKELLSLVSTFGEVTEPENVSRLDLFADFCIPIDFSDIAFAQWVTRCKRRHTHYMGDTFSGYSFGKGGDISANLYNKSLEILTSKKFYLEDLWKDKGWDGESTVYRLEYQIKNRVLAEHQAKQVDQVISRAGGIWLYCLLKWLKLTVPNPDDDNRARWLLHPLWEALADITWYESFEGASVPIRLKKIPDDSYLYRNGLSGLISFMAINGFTDFDEGTEEYKLAATAYFREYASLTGIDIYGYVTEKVALKSREYNLITERDRERQAEERAFYAEQYKRAKDGD